MAKITLPTIKAARPRPDRDWILWDTDLPGFGLRILPTGRRVFIVQYRMGGRGAPQRRLKLGLFGVLTAATAREMARAALAMVAQQRDPQGEKIATRAAATRTLELSANEWLMESEGKRAPSTLSLYRWMFDALVLPDLGKRPVGMLTHAEIAAWHARMAAKPAIANRALAALSALLAWCTRRGDRPAQAGNPAQGVERFREEKRERFLSETEIAAAGEAIAGAERAGMNLYAVAALRLLFLTGARRDEIRTLRWAWVDLARGLLLLPVSKTGAKAVRLPPAAVQLLANLPRREGSPFVFPGRSNDAPIANLNRAWEQVRRAAGLGDVRLHDIRHSFASLGLAQGMGLPVLGRLLGHSKPSTTQRYAHLADDFVSRASAKVGDRLGNLMGIAPPAAARTESAQLVDMPAPRKRAGSGQG